MCGHQDLNHVLYDSGLDAKATRTLRSFRRAAGPDPIAKDSGELVPVERLSEIVIHAGVQALLAVALHWRGQSWR